MCKSRNRFGGADCAEPARPRDTCVMNSTPVQGRCCQQPPQREKTDMPPRKMKLSRGILTLIIFLLLGGSRSVWAAHGSTPASADEIAILVPDKVDFADPMVSLWLDAGSEEGLHIVAVHDSDFCGSALHRKLRESSFLTAFTVLRAMCW